MRAHQDHYIHDLSVETISTILKNDAWKVANQTLYSADTNDNELKEPNEQWSAIGENTAGPNAFSDIKFDHTVKRILDVGGGKFDGNRNYMKREKNIDLLVWDPYNRSQSHNVIIQEEVTKHKVDAVTSMSVLNVIPEAEIRLAHITTLKTALITGGKAYFKIWPGESPLQGSYLPSATDTSYQANAYADRFLREIEIVFGRGNVNIDKNIPNLIVAVKLTEADTNPRDIMQIQKKSKNELIPLTRIRQKSIDHLFFNKNVLKLFSTNLSFFKTLGNELIQQNRNVGHGLKHEYDKKQGLIIYKRS